MAYLRQRGIGAYSHSGDWTWEYYPPPYDFLAPADSVAMPAPVVNGLGGCHCGGTCGGCGGHSHGMGLFDSGLDYSGWGLAEFAVVGAGVYLGVSLISDLFSAGRTVGRVRRAYRAASAEPVRKAKRR